MWFSFSLQSKVWWKTLKTSDRAIVFLVYLLYYTYRLLFPALDNDNRSIEWNANKKYCHGTVYYPIKVDDFLVANFVDTTTLWKLDGQFVLYSLISRLDPLRNLNNG
jgi:hypothetical protein